MNSNYLNFQDIVLVCNDMLTQRKPDVELSFAGKAMVPMLEAYVKKSEKLFPGISSGKVPFAAELGTEDMFHDASGSSIIKMSDAYLGHPEVNKQVKDVMRMVRQTYITEGEELQGTYANEAANAIQRKALLATHEAELKSIPLAPMGDPPVPASLYDWVSSFLASGERIGVLLAQRADKEGKAHAGLLRSEMLGILDSFRENLKREAKLLGALPADIDTRVFGYMDMMIEARAGGKKKAGAKGEPEGTKTP